MITFEVPDGENRSNRFRDKDKTYKKKNVYWAEPNFSRSEQYECKCTGRVIDVAAARYPHVFTALAPISRVFISIIHFIIICVFWRLLLTLRRHV